MSHQELFIQFMGELDAHNIDYVFIRGFEYLPEKPNTDIDCVVYYKHWDRFVEIATNHLDGPDIQNYGFAEWAEMYYWPIFTPGEPDPSLPNERFRLDFYNCLHFFSPYNDYKTRWTLPKDFNDYVFETRIFYNGFFIPSPVCEIILLLARTLDFKGGWKDKYKVRIAELLPTVPDEELERTLAMVFPNADKLVEAFHAEDFDSTSKLLGL